jgi:peptidoglycan/xylan/chitin deacetylase (PgdA/CDA1 family)
MDTLKAHYNVLSPANLLEIIKGGRELPQKAALLTFDDGYRDNLEHAYPILKELGLSAILFVPTDFIDQERTLPHDENLGLSNPTLTWEQLREIQDVFVIGSHGRSHRVLTGLQLSEAVNEIATSKTQIEQQLGSPVHFFSYPKGSLGDFSDDLEGHVRDAGYVASFVTLPGANAYPAVRSGSQLRRYNAEPFGDFTFARLLDGSCDLIALKDTSLGVNGKRYLNRILGTTTR